MIDIVDYASAVTDFAECADDVEDVRGLAQFLDQRLGVLVIALGQITVVVENAGTIVVLAADAPVEFHAADTIEIVALEGEEQVEEQVLRGLLGRRLARTHHAVDFDERLERRLGRVDAQCARYVRTTIQVVDPQRGNLLDAALAEFLQQSFVEFFVGQRQQFASLLVDYVVRHDATEQVVVRHFKRVDVFFLQLAYMARGDALARLDDDLLASTQIEVQRLAAQAFGDELKLGTALLAEGENVLLEEQVEHLGVGVAERAQQHGDRQLAAAVDTREQAVLGIEFEIEPGTAVGNDTGGEQQLARAVGLAAIVIEEHARATDAAARR